VTSCRLSIDNLELWLFGHFSLVISFVKESLCVSVQLCSPSTNTEEITSVEVAKLLHGSMGPMCQYLQGISFQYIWMLLLTTAAVSFCLTGLLSGINVG